MNVIIRKIGNSEGIIIPKEILQKRGLAAGDNLVIMEDGDDLRIKRVQDDREEFERKMKIARERMKKYEVALRELAK
ncbi:MAG: AbrB family transcriptional regulator [Phyllobacteriaceae bacterium]|uniref:AbrB/MazE/SpoVT family DNA-binding domain-containing protein n=1 Tax=Zhengella sedimenti TaxID=3390035 RepID=UPI000C6794AC|nr:AbrB family transcriptional regulator [Phyllobacteriaceae bacterium]MBA92849.1 AbrB family transcriptional regulator [Phyllobacteriaceae bacterium]